MVAGAVLFSHGNRMTTYGLFAICYTFMGDSIMSMNEELFFYQTFYKA